MSWMNREILLFQDWFPVLFYSFISINLDFYTYRNYYLEEHFLILVFLLLWGFLFCECDKSAPVDLVKCVDLKLI